MPLACQACDAETSQAELNLSGAGQWLCRSCFGSYQVAAATHRSRENDIVRRCSCGTAVAPLSDAFEPSSEDGSVFFLRRDVYVCSGCAKTFAVPHPLLNVVLIPVCGYVAYAVWHQKPEDAQIDEMPEAMGPIGAWILGGFVVVWLARDFYYRWRYRRV